MEPPRLRGVSVAERGIERLAPEIGDAQYEQLLEAAERSRRLMAGRVVWNVSSTEHGGGVAEMLSPLIAYARGAGVDTRWVVIGGAPAFFVLTKRLHNRLHGEPGDGGPLGDAEQELYRRTLEVNAAELRTRVRPGDVVILHDPQSLGLVPAVRKLGATAVWRCHIGVAAPNRLVRDTWEFLIAFARQADACVFSRSAYAWEGLRSEAITIIAPALDPVSAKNQEIGPDAVRAILHRAGLVSGRSGTDAGPAFTRSDGTDGRVERAAWLVSDTPPQLVDRLVMQISRWDALKDPQGVMRAFAEHVAPVCDAHLMLAGPAVATVSDDPDEADVFAACVGQRAELGPEIRARVHLACLPMEDAQENAAMVNALQRHADVVVQKSLAEGFGLTVAEAMWKARPVVASRAGGIEDQIVDGESGVLIEAADLVGFGRAVVALLDDRQRAATMGARARERVRTNFLAPRQLIDYARLLARLEQRAVAGPSNE